MSKPMLILGNKRYSSWSLRGYLALRFARLDFDETVIPLFMDDTHDQMKALAPDAPSKVPMLVEAGHAIWDTMSLMEYAAEISVNGPLWPEDKYARAHARSITAEMHAGFFALREHIPMNLSVVKEFEAQPDSVQADIDRILEIWTQCRKAYGTEGPYLFGKLSVADAAFAPVVVRLKSRSIPVDELCQKYMDAIWALPDFIKWREDAAQEEWIIEQ